MLGLFVLGTLCGLLWALERCFDNPQVYPGGPGTQYRAWASFRRFTGVGFAAWRVCFVAGCGALGFTCELVRFRGQLWGRSHKAYQRGASGFGRVSRLETRTKESSLHAR